MLCYYNNGLAMRGVEDDYVPQAGEQVFDDYQTPEQLAAAFASYNAAKTAETNAQACKDDLAKTDVTMLRIQEAIVAGATTWTATDVVAWIDYRRSLRAGTLATKPPYPAGT